MEEAQLAKLSECDFVIVIDKSGSMGEEDMPGGRSRWDYMQETACAFTRDVCKLDADGVGVVLFSGASIVAEDGCNYDKVKQILSNNKPSGGTPLHSALEAAFKLAGKSDKKDFVLVFTDGVPDDKAAAADVIRRQTQKMNSDDELTVLFVQVGRDEAAGRYLKKLDDDLTGCKYDIVDAKTIDEAEKFGSTAELVLAAIAD